MFSKIKKLWASKISINITIIEPAPDGIVKSTVPRAIDNPITVSHLRKSNLRFVEETRTDWDGKGTTFYSTEHYKNGSWLYVNDTINADKEKAMELHLKLLERGSLDPIKVKTVMWEGLSQDETRAWVELQIPSKERQE